MDLLITLLKSICHLPVPYPSGWHNVPPDGDVSTSANLVRLQCFPAQLTKMTSYDAKVWDRMVSVFSGFAGPSCQALIDEIAVSPIPAKERREYLASVDTYAKNTTVCMSTKTRAEGAGKRRKSEQHYISATVVVQQTPATPPESSPEQVCHVTSGNWQTCDYREGANFTDTMRINLFATVVTDKSHKFGMFVSYCNRFKNLAMFVLKVD